MTDANAPTSELILYQTEDGRTRIECRFEGETVWLTQALMAELFQTSPQNITQHLREIYAEGELDEAATCKSFLQVRTEGGRQVSRSLRFYNLDAIISVGYRVRSTRGTQFRKWATARLSEYLVKGFTMDDRRDVRDGREAAQEASAAASKASEGEVVNVSGERTHPANRAAKIGLSFSPRFLPCAVSRRREHHALDVERVAASRATLST
jgi:hypothetical protein